MMDERLLHWLAGLLEGEGSFLKRAPSDGNRSRITIEMTDEDIIQRVTTIFGLNYYNSSRKPAKAHHKNSYQVTFRGGRAAEFMRLLRPLMGSRRQAQIDLALAAYEPKINFSTAPKNPPKEHDDWWSLPEDQPVSTIIPDVNEFYWLAGLIEGEGYFAKGPLARRQKSSIRIKMTDEDVIQHVARLWGFERYNSHQPQEENYKRFYQTRLHGRRAVKLMQELRPLMSQRRQHQIDEVMASYAFLQERGSKHHNAKLTEEDVMVIRDRLAEGEKLSALARAYGVDTGLI